MNVKGPSSTIVARVADENLRARKVKREKQRKARREKRVQLREIFAERDRAVREGNYEVLGRVLTIKFENCNIDFFKQGPVLAQILNTTSLVLLNDWQGFPAAVESLPELCDECRVTCTDCEGEGKRLCMHVGCGGEGRVILSRKACDAKDCAAWTGRAKPNCKKCSGGGQLVDQATECPCCKGKKKQDCPRCQGSGQMPTGFEHGTEGQRCKVCNGSRHKSRTTAQRWEDHVLGYLEDYTVLGPIEGILILSDVLRDPERGAAFVQFLQDENGNLGALLLPEPEKHGTPMYLFGGQAVIPQAKEVTVQ